MLISPFKNIKYFIKLAQSKLTKKQFIFLSSILVGLSAGLAAILLKTIVHSIFYLATYDKLSSFSYLYLVLPVIGIFLTVFVIKRLFGGEMEKGLAQVHYAIAKKSSLMKRSKMFDQVITSSLTVGFGGSVGLEAPIVITGAAIGSNYSKNYHLNYNERTLLLACGVSAGIGAAFNAPIAGVLFALEVLLLDISISAFTPLILAAATGALISKIVLNENILLFFQLKNSFNYANVPFYALFGVLAGFIAVYHARTVNRIESFFSRFKNRIYVRVFLGGLLLALLIAVFPSLFGEGYQSIKSLASSQPNDLLENSIFSDYKFNQWFVLFFIGILILLKAVATGITLGAGGNGGNFAPSLFVGAYLGYFFSKSLNLLNITSLPVNNFTLVGMAGILSGLYHAPLTAIFLIAEITGGYTLMIPLMIVSSISFAIARYFEPFSMDTKKIAASGDLFTNDRDQNVLMTIKIETFIEKDYPVLLPDFNLGKLVAIISNSKRNVFPVVDVSGNLTGLVLLDDVREIMFKKDFYAKILVKELMIKPAYKIETIQGMTEVMSIFDESEAWALPVTEGGKYVGFISKSIIFNGYRSKLKMAKIE